MKLLPYEIPGAIYLEHQRFSTENGRLTTTFKLSRPKLKESYKGIFQELYNESKALKFDSIISDVLGVDLSSEKSSTFRSIGGDSLAAVKLNSLLKSTLQVTFM